MCYLCDSPDGIHRDLAQDEAAEDLQWEAAVHTQVQAVHAQVQVVHTQVQAVVHPLAPSPSTDSPFIGTGSPSIGKGSPFIGKGSPSIGKVPSPQLYSVRTHCTLYVHLLPSVFLSLYVYCILQVYLRVHQHSPSLQILTLNPSEFTFPQLYSLFPLQDSRSPPTIFT